MPYPTDPTPSGGYVEAEAGASVQQLLIDVRVARELLDIINHLVTRMDERLTAIEDALAD